MSEVERGGNPDWSWEEIDSRPLPPPGSSDRRRPEDEPEVTNDEPPESPPPEPVPTPISEGRILSPLASHEYKEREEQPEKKERVQRRIVSARERRENCAAEVLRTNPRSVDELLALIEGNSFEQIKDAELENKYRGMTGRLRAWMNGEHDYLNHDPNQRRVWNELARRGARCVLNKNFIRGAAVFGALGILTGGVGWASGGVLLGSVAGRAIGEMREMIAGETGHAREDLLMSERERWETLQELSRMLRDTESRGGDEVEISRLEHQLYEAQQDSSRREEVEQLEVQLEAARNPDKTLANDTRRAILDIYFKQDETAAIHAVNEKLGKYKTGEETAGTAMEFGYSGERLAQAERSLAEKVEKYEKFSRRLTTVGAVAGGAIGAAHSILAGSVEHITLDNIGTQFGHAANGADIWHQVVQHDGAWHYLYNSAGEYGHVLQHVHQAGAGQFFAHGLVPIGEQTGHILSSSAQGIGLNETTGWVTAALVGERVLPVLAAVLTGRGEKDKNVQVGKQTSKKEVADQGTEKADANEKETIGNIISSPTDYNIKVWQQLRATVPETAEYLENLARVNNVRIPVSPVNREIGWYQQGQLLEETFKLHQLPIWYDRFENEKGENEIVGICESNPAKNEVIIATKRLVDGKVSYQWHAWRLDEFLKRYRPGAIQEQPQPTRPELPEAAPITHGQQMGQEVDFAGKKWRVGDTIPGDDPLYRLDSNDGQTDRRSHHEWHRRSELTGSPAPTEPLPAAPTPAMAEDSPAVPEPAKFNTGQEVKYLGSTYKIGRVMGRNGQRLYELNHWIEGEKQQSITVTENVLLANIPKQDRIGFRQPENLVTPVNREVITYPPKESVRHIEQAKPEPTVAKESPKPPLHEENQNHAENNPALPTEPMPLAPKELKRSVSLVEGLWEKLAYQPKDLLRQKGIIISSAPQYRGAPESFSLYLRDLDDGRGRSIRVKYDVKTKQPYIQYGYSDQNKFGWHEVKNPKQDEIITLLSDIVHKFDSEVAPNKSPQEHKEPVPITHVTETGEKRVIVPEKLPSETATETIPENFKLGQATWRNADYDQPIVVTGYLGEKDGRHYVAAEGSTTGYPLDEIEYSQPEAVPELPASAIPASQLPSLETSNPPMDNIDRSIFQPGRTLNFRDVTNGDKAGFLDGIKEHFEIDRPINQVTFQVLDSKSVDGDIEITIRGNGQEGTYFLSQLLDSGLLKLPKSARNNK